MTGRDHKMVSGRRARSAVRTFFSLHLNGAIWPASQLPLLNNSLREYDDDSKLQIILAIYTQMVTYIQEIRARVERIVIVGSGLIILLDGWFVAASHTPTVSGKFVASVGVGLFTGVLVLVLRALQRQFYGYAEVIRRVNEVQRVYEQGTFLQGQTLYPEAWKAFGAPAWKEPIFTIARPILLAIGIFGIVAIWFV